jgi:protoheme IX farnesyltransferase
VLIATMIGTSLSCMGATIFNQIIERDIDALMPRTQNRPLATRRISPKHAFVLGTTLAIIGVGILWPIAGWLPAALSAFTILSYVLIYTPMKQATSLATIVGAAPGALPPVIGYTAASGSIDLTITVMFAIMFLWQIPHFLAIAWMYRDDYGKASIPVLPVLDPTGASTFRQMLIGCMALLPLGLMPTVLGMASIVYFIGALIAGAFFLATAIALVMKPSTARARTVFFASLVYLPVVFALMVIDG